jgi:GTPase
LILFLGLDSDELKGSLTTLNAMATSLDADLTIVNELIVPKTNRKAVEALVRRRLFDGKSWFSDIRIVLIGSHNSGKSTILGKDI